jgi:hypothetical protein
MPLDLDRIILTQLYPIVPKFKRDVGGTDVDFNAVLYAVVFRTRVPPVAIFEFEKGEGKRGKIGLYFANGATG